MQSVEIIFDGIPLIVPAVNGIPVEIPFKRWNDPISFCGAGSGIGDLVVPETVIFLPISLACYLHDQSWTLALPLWSEFHQSNSIFLHNILSIVKSKSNSLVLEHLRNYRAVTYYNAVDTVGSNIFWKIKGEENAS